MGQVGVRRLRWQLREGIWGLCAEWRPGLLPHLLRVSCEVITLNAIREVVECAALCSSALDLRNQDPLTGAARPGWDKPALQAHSAVLAVAFAFRPVSRMLS